MSASNSSASPLRLNIRECWRPASRYLTRYFLPSLWTLIARPRLPVRRCWALIAFSSVWPARASRVTSPRSRPTRATISAGIRTGRGVVMVVMPRMLASASRHRLIRAGSRTGAPDAGAAAVAGRIGLLTSDVRRRIADSLEPVDVLPQLVGAYERPAVVDHSRQRPLPGGGPDRQQGGHPEHRGGFELLDLGRGHASLPGGHSEPALRVARQSSTHEEVPVRSRTCSTLTGGLGDAARSPATLRAPDLPPPGSLRGAPSFWASRFWSVAWRKCLGSRAAVSEPGESSASSCSGVQLELRAASTTSLADPRPPGRPKGGALGHRGRARSRNRQPLLGVAPRGAMKDVSGGWLRSSVAGFMGAWRGRATGR